ncbi:MAG TPA: DUF2239 family protein [Vicinamibacterales bacterium]|jgi:hypothetical protein
MELERTYTAFAGDTLVASADVKSMLVRTKKYLDRTGDDRILIFDDHTGAQVDFDFRGTADDVLERLSSHPLFRARERPPAERSGPGRPKLGVLSREVSLLPRHWDWLEQQPNGISAALRRLVDEARKREPASDRARGVRHAASRFMTAMAGNLAGFEEASRALFANDVGRMKALTHGWPRDVRKHLWRLVDESVRLEASENPADE